MTATTERLCITWSTIKNNPSPFKIFMPFFKKKASSVYFFREGTKSATWRHKNVFFRGILSHFFSPHHLFLWRHIFLRHFVNSPSSTNKKKNAMLSPNFYGLERLLLKKGFVPDQTLWGKPQLCLFSWPCLRGKTRQNLISEFIQNALSFN